MADLVVRRRYDRTSAPNDGWWKGKLGTTLWEAPLYVPIGNQTRNSFRTGDRVGDTLQVESRQHDATYVWQTQPSFSWLYGHSPVLWEAPKYAPIGAAQAASFRTPARRADQSYCQTDTNDGWIFAALAPAWDPALSASINDQQRLQGPASRRPEFWLWQTDPNDGWQKGALGTVLWEANLFPGIRDQATHSSYRSADRQQDKLFIRQTQPNDGWLKGVLGLWEAPLFTAIGSQLSSAFRTPDSRADRFFIRFTSPNPGWIPFGAQLGSTGNVLVLATAADLSTGIPLLGSPNLALVTSSALTTAIVLGSSVSLVLATSSDLSTAIKLASSANLVLATSSDLATGIPLLGAPILVLATSGAITTGIPLLAAPNLVLATSGAIATGIPLLSSANLALATAADLATEIRLAASANLVLITSAGLGIPVHLDGSSVLSLATAADLSTAIQLAASGNLVIVTNADLTAMQSEALFGDARIMIVSTGTLGIAPVLIYVDGRPYPSRFSLK